MSKIIRHRNECPQPRNIRIIRSELFGDLSKCAHNLNVDIAVNSSIVRVLHFVNASLTGPGTISTFLKSTSQRIKFEFYYYWNYQPCYVLRGSSWSEEKEDENEFL